MRIEIDIGERALGELASQFVFGYRGGVKSDRAGVGRTLRPKES